MLNTQKYKNLLEEVWPEITNKFGNDIIFQDDNCKIHRASIINSWKDDSKIESLDWAPQSPDLNVIENVWSNLKGGLSKYADFPSSEEILKTRVMEVWANISTDYIRDLIKTMPKRCSMILEKKVGSIKY